jgi:hypothetical protein
VADPTIVPVAKRVDACILEAIYGRHAGLRTMRYLARLAIEDAGQLEDILIALKGPV